MKDLYEKLVSKTRQLAEAAAAGDMNAVGKLRVEARILDDQIIKRKVRFERVFAKMNPVEEGKGEETTRQIIHRNSQANELLKKWFEIEACANEKCRHPLHPYGCK